MKTIPIFFSVSEQSVPGFAAALDSIRNHASTRFNYHIHILCTELSKESVRRILSMEKGRISVEFAPLSEDVGTDVHSACRLITLLYPDYEKCIFLRSGIVPREDISDLWEEPLGHKIYGSVDGKTSSDVLLVNLKRIREAGFPRALPRNEVLYLDPCWGNAPDAAFRKYALASVF